MIKNILKTTFRSIRKNRIISLINIFGLSVAITVCLSIYQYVHYELSYDKFNENRENVYRIERDPFCTIAPSFAPLLKKDFPEIDKIARMAGPWNSQVSNETNSFIENNICFAEQDIIDILNFKIIEGDRQNALNIDQVVISKSIATKYFGNENPIGKKLKFFDNDYLTVSAIMEDYPENSHLKCDFLCSYLSLRDKDTKIEDDYFLGNNNFSDNVTLVYVKFGKHTNIKDFESKISSFIDRYIPANKNNDGNDQLASSFINLTTRKVSDIHLHSHKLNEIKTNSDISYIYLFSILAFLIVIIACINFFNLSTATIDNRFNEFGVKKVFGINKGTIYYQFFFESGLLIVFSSVLAIALNLLIRPHLLAFLGINNNLQIHPFNLFIALFALIVILSFITGIVPGKFISKQKPIQILKSSRITGQLHYRNVLVVFQFVVAIGLFVSIGTIYKQIGFINKKELGYDKNNIILIPSDNEIVSNWNSIHQQLLSNPDILEASLSKGTIGSRLLDDPGLSFNINGEWNKWPGKIPHIRTDFNFFKTYGIQFLAGRNFNPEISSDSLNAFILNETAAKKIGFINYNDIIGKQLRTANRTGEIIGVVKDFHYESLHTAIIPMVTYYELNSTNTLSVKINQSSKDHTIGFINEVLNNYHTDYQFSYSFFDNRLAQQYKNESRMMSLISYASLLAIFIACIGLMGLSLFMAERKTKEIGVRKVNGAKVSEILALLNKDFVKWVAISFVIATPIAWYAMHKWLANFAYKTSLSWWIFALAGLLALGIALLTVSFQSWKAATRNPVEALRYE